MKFRLSDTSHIFSRYIYQINWSRNICCNLKLKFILHDSPLSQKTKFEDGFKGKIVNFFSYEEFLTVSHHFYLEKLMTYFQTQFHTPAEAKLEDFSSQNLIIFTIISNLLVPTVGHRTDANKMEIYLFYCFLEKFESISALSCANFCSKSALIAIGNSPMKSF